MVDARDPKKTEAPEKAAQEDAVETGAMSDIGDAKAVPVEIGGRKGPDPTRYGDWEKGGRCIDF